VGALRAVLTRIDEWQRHTKAVAVAYGVIKKFGDDRLNQYVVGLGWYGFLAIYPLLLVVVTVLGFIGVSSLGSGLVSTLHQFPVAGSQFNPAQSSHHLHGSLIGLVVGLVGLLYGAQGVMQTAQGAMAQAWNVPQVKLPSLLPSLLRSLFALLITGCFVVNAALATLATGSSPNVIIRVLTLLGLVLLNAGSFLAAFRALTPIAPTRALWPGAVVGGLGFTILITIGSGLVDHQLRHSSSTYGQFGAVIGLVGFLLLLAKLSLYGAELNPVLSRHLWPRGLVGDDPTEADDHVLRDLVHETQRRDDQAIDVSFGDELQAHNQAERAE
jgi:uncharacterized BrkB/YihY/UPF0761 family membrane protein